jgi:hypothetical protein
MIFDDIYGTPHIFHWWIHAHRRWRRQELMSGQDGVFTRLDRFQEGAQAANPWRSATRKEFLRKFGEMVD